MLEYDVMGFGDPQEKARNFYQEVLGLSTKAVHEGRNPAEVLYNLAKTWGYRNNASSATRELSSASNEDAAKRIETVRKGQKVSTSLSDSAGTPEALNLTDIERMSDDEFDKLWKKLETSGR